VRASKRALNALEGMESMPAALEANGPIFASLMRTKDFREGVTAFAEKRTPRWKNE
jgi:acetyl-CoA C-acetyltransferase